MKQVNLSMKQQEKYLYKYKTRKKNRSGYKKKHPRIGTLSNLYM